jgi:hypothetical protein
VTQPGAAKALALLAVPIGFVSFLAWARRRGQAGAQLFVRMLVLLSFFASFGSANLDWLVQPPYWQFIFWSVAIFPLAIDALIPRFLGYAVAFSASFALAMTFVMPPMFVDCIHFSNMFSAEWAFLAGLAFAVNRAPGYFERLIERPWIAGGRKSSGR